MSAYISLKNEGHFLMPIDNQEPSLLTDLESVKGIGLKILQKTFPVSSKTEIQLER